MWKVPECNFSYINLILCFVSINTAYYVHVHIHTSLMHTTLCTIIDVHTYVRMQYFWYYYTDCIWSLMYVDLYQKHCIPFIFILKIGDLIKKIWGHWKHKIMLYVASNQIVDIYCILKMNSHWHLSAIIIQVLNTRRV